MHVYGNALIHQARNKALATVRPDAYAFFLDDDMLPEKDALMRLLADRQPVVSALCTTRMEPVEIAAKVYDQQTDQFAPLSRVKLNKLLVGQFGVGAAFMLMDRPTVDALIEYYMTARDWLDEHQPMFHRLHVRAERREAERVRRSDFRRARWLTEKQLRVFDYMDTDAELQLGEDITLCRKLIKLGIPVALDTSVQVGHLGERPYGIWDVVRREVETEAAA